MKKFLIIFLLFPFGFSCDPPAEETTSNEVSEWTDEAIADNVVDQPNADLNEVILEADASEWLIYEGTIPCADCQGIQMRLKLENKSGADDKAYELTETYLGTKDGNRSFQNRGVYQITYGHDNDPAAILITLVDKNNDQRILIQEASENLTILDQEGKVINSKLNYTLQKLK